MTEIVISALAPDEAATVARIHAACFDEAWDEATIRKVMALPGAFGLAARAEPAGAITGFALGRVTADECELLSLGVAPERRGQGYGAQLLDAAIVRACAAEATRFILEVAEDNEVALRLYETRGLVAVGRRPRYYLLKNGQRTAALTMRCDLPIRQRSVV